MSFFNFVFDFLRMGALSAVLALVFPMIRVAYGKPYVESLGQIEFDWSRMRLRFYGEYQPQPMEKNVDYAQARAKAVGNGLMMARDKIAEYHRQHLLSLGENADVAGESGLSGGERTAKASWVASSEYFPDGSVRVQMESVLSRALLKQSLNLPVQTPPEVPADSRFTGLLLRCSQATAPVAFYRITDESGQLLFSIRDVASSAYEKNLMGRWFTDPGAQELSQLLGPRPASLDVTFLEKGHFRVHRAAWDQMMEGQRHLLERAQIVIALPAGSGESL
ncbi:MAG: hypothetical protein H6618_09790 [Deltaproteobacteria bacterium]|nr:hypothetical protein [Deltaproteobacteria bacterium]